MIATWCIVFKNIFSSIEKGPTHRSFYF